MIEAALRIATFVFLIIALRGVRWAYVAFVLLSLTSFAVRAGFPLEPTSCELLVGSELALYSFRNYPHIVLFALFAILSRLQFKGTRGYAWAFVATLVFGALLELAQGLSGNGHCRLRDLLPDGAGALIGLLAFAAVRKAWSAVF